MSEIAELYHHLPRSRAIAGNFNSHGDSKAALTQQLPAKHVAVWAVTTATATATAATAATSTPAATIATTPACLCISASLGDC